jgi:hypothetical protein
MRVEQLSRSRSARQGITTGSTLPAKSKEEQPAVHPGLAAFKEAVCTTFAFLTHDFGFTEESRKWRNEYSVSFVKPDDASIRRRRHLGAGARLTLGRSGTPWNSKATICTTFSRSVALSWLRATTS